MTDLQTPPSRLSLYDAIHAKSYSAAAGFAPPPPYPPDEDYELDAPPPAARSKGFYLLGVVAILTAGFVLIAALVLAFGPNPSPGSCGTWPI